MTTSAPWEALPGELADVLEGELDAIAEAIVAAIGEEVPDYARPLEGSFGRGVRLGVTQALGRFLALVREPGSPDPASRRVYFALGRDELRAGRTLDALQSAYRIGARVAWRRIAVATDRAGFGPAVLTALAEAIFAYIDELSAESVDGYAQAQSELAGERERLARALVDALLAGSGVRDAAEAAGWNVPRSAAAVACAPDRAPGLARRLGADALAAVVDGTGCVVAPDAAGPGRDRALRTAIADRPAAIGPDLELSRFADSWRLARAALGLAGTGPVHADERLGDLLLAEGALVTERIAARRLAALDDLTPRAAARMRDTALAYVQLRGSAPAMARSLGVHPQTVRYRIARLRELLGDQLDDPDARFELEASLRALSAGG